MPTIVSRTRTFWEASEAEPVSNSNAAQSRTRSVAISVTSKSADPKKPLAVNSFYSNTTITDVTKQQLLLFTKVRVGQSSVLKAAVMMTITDPSGQGHPIILLDNGRGVDEQANDGIYSAYFSDFSAVSHFKVPQAFQSATLVTGSPDTYYLDTEDAKAVKTGPFRRSINNPTFYVTLQDKSQKTVDTVPPGRIGDLVAANVTYSKGTVLFTWTATGRDYSVGTASQYILKSSANYQDLLDNFDSLPPVDLSRIVAGSLSPLQSGQKMTVTLGSYKKSDFFYFALVAKDSAGNTSPMSSVVAVNFTDPATHSRDPRKSIAFVLDTSESMASDTPTRISVLGDVVSQATECLGTGASVGMGVFADYAYGTLLLTTIESDFSRDTVKKHIPDYAVGNTDLGGGINEGIQILKGGLHNTTFSRIVIVSDGGEDAGTCACDKSIQNEIRWSNVTVDTVAIGPAHASVLVKLATKWGGSSYFVNTGSSGWKDMVQSAAHGICDSINTAESSRHLEVTESSASSLYDNEDKLIDCTEVSTLCS